METYRNFGLELLNADKEMDVREIMSRPVFDDVEWTALGDQENNYGVVENQAGSAMGALTEIIVNSIDATLLKHYDQQFAGVDESPNYSTMKEAASALFDENTEPEPITVGAEGEQKPQSTNIISLVIEDLGQGQNQDEFQDKFLGLLDPGMFKQDYEFLQGQYGMGSTGVLPFCGDKGYKLIMSAGFDSPSEWSWSLVRKRRDKNRYEYLTFDGEVPKFSGEVRGQSYGTFVKLYDYQIDQRSNVTSHTNLRRFLERYLWDIPIPVELEERREGFNSLGKTTTKGGLPHIEEDLSDIVEKNYYIEHDFESEILGTRNIHVLVFKRKSTLSDSQQRDWELFVGGEKHRKQAVFFIVNGQTHGDEGKSFIKTQCELPQVAKDSLFIVEFSDIEGADLVDLFKPSRDRLKNNQIAADLLEGVEDALQNDRVLADLEADRRTRSVTESSDADVEKSFKKFVMSDDALRDYFEQQGDIEFEFSEGFLSRGLNPEDSSPVVDIDFDPPFIPDKLNIIETYRSRVDYDVWDKNEFYEVTVPINRSKRIRFELNAPNDYFERGNSSGEIRVTPSEVLKSRQLTDGILSIRVKAMPNATPGDQFSSTIEVTRPSGESLKQPFRVRYSEPKEETDTSSSQQRGMGFQPKIIQLEEDELEDEGMEIEDIVEIHDYLKSEGVLEFYINVDSLPLRRFKKDHDVDAPDDVINNLYARSVSLFTATQYFRIKEDFDGSDIDPIDLVNKSMRGMVQAIISTVLTPENLSA